MQNENAATAQPEPEETIHAAQAPQEAEAPPSPWAGLQVRIVSGVAVAVPAALLLCAGGWWFTLFTMVAGLVALREWDILTARSRVRWSLAGLLYIGVPCASLIWLRGQEFGLSLSLYAMLAVIATDIGAYAAGRAIGGLKLAPHISPNKTWAGLGGGVGAAIVVGAIGFSFTPFPGSFFGCAFLAGFLAIVAQIGDLFESWVKRRFGVKDSGALIPGHGGLLDRIDGLMTAIPVFALFYWLGHA